MKVIGLNGSPRKNWNSAQMLEHALKGAAAAGAMTTSFGLMAATVVSVIFVSLGEAAGIE